MIGLNVYSFIMPGIKLISSICISGILGALIGWLGIFTNRSIGYIWAPEIHLFIYFAFIGFGSGRVYGRGSGLCFEGGGLSIGGGRRGCVSRSFRCAGGGRGGAVGGAVGGAPVL